MLMKAAQAPNQNYGEHLKIIELLIEKGKADPLQVNKNNGWTALKYAQTYNPNEKIVEHLAKMQGDCAMTD